MSGSIIAGVLWLFGVAVAGTAVVAWLPRSKLYDAWQSRSDEAGRTADGAIRGVGRVVTAAVVILAGWAFAIITCWVLGLLAHRLEAVVDRPVFDWFAARQISGWTQIWHILTQLGNRPETEALTLVGALMFAMLLRRGRWWVPLTLLPIGYLMEKYGGQILKQMVHRGHPPTTLGTWVSGGCARLIVVYGLIIFFGLRWRRVQSRQVRVAAWSALAFLAAVEAYSRTYLLKHWVTDVAGGLVFGTMILLAVIFTAQVLDRIPLLSQAHPEAMAQKDATF
jgi:membrane-associated phospholipid phosphatase